MPKRNLQNFGSTIVLDFGLKYMEFYVQDSDFSIFILQNCYFIELSKKKWGKIPFGQIIPTRVGRVS